MKSGDSGSVGAIAVHQAIGSVASAGIVAWHSHELFEEATGGIYSTSPAGENLMVSPALARTLGFESPEELATATSRSLERLWADADALEEFRRLLDKTGAVDGYETRFRNKDGSPVAVSVNGRMVFDADGRLVHQYALVHDITARQRSEDARREAENRYRDIFEGAIEGIYRVTPVGKVLAANLSMAKMLGYDSVDEFVTSITDSSRQLWADSAERMKLVERVEAQGFVRGWECRFRKKDDSVVWVAMNGRAVRGAEGQTLCYEGFVQDITERKRAEDELRRSRDLLRAILDGTPDVVYLKDREGRVVVANSALLRTVGRTEEQVIGNTSLEYFEDPQSARAVIEHERRVMETGVAESLEVAMNGPQGTRTFIATKSPYRDSEGHVIGIIGVSHDITERKRAEQALHVNEYRAMQAEKLAHVGSAQWDIDTGTGSWSDEFYRIIGREPGTPIPPGEEIAALFTSESWARLRVAGENCLATGAPQDLELEFVRPDGTIRQTLVHMMPTTNSLGRVNRLYASVQDITDQRQAFNALLRSEDRFRLAMEATQDGIWDWDPGTGESYFSPGYYRMLGYEPGDVPASRAGWLNLVHPGDIEEATKPYREASEGAAGQLETRYRMRTRDGEWRWILSRCQCIERDVVGHVRRMVGTHVDITESRQAVEALRESEARFRGLIEQAPVAIGVWRSGLGLYANQMFLETYRMRSEDFVNMTVAEIVAPPFQARAREQVLRYLRGGGVPTDFETISLRQDGSEFAAHIVLSEVRLSDGPAVLSFTTDISARRKAEDELREREALLNETGRMARVGGWKLDLDRHELTWTREVYRIHEVDEDFTPTMECAIAFYTPECRPVIEGAVQRAIEQGEPFDLELEIVTARNNRRWVHSVGVRRELGGGTPVVSGTFQDITLTKQAESARRESEARFAAIVRSSPNMITLLELNEAGDRIIEVNAAFEKVTGYSRDEAIGHSREDLGLCAEPEGLTRVWAQIQSGVGVRNFEYRLRRKNGELRECLLSMEPIILGGARYAVSITADVTDHKLSLEKLRDSERRLRALSARMEMLREEERTRMARDVHDVLGSLLTCMKINLGWVENGLEELAGDPRVNAITDKVVATTELVDSTIESVQRIAADLRPGLLDKVGLAAAILAEGERFQRRTGLICRVAVVGDSHCDRSDIATAIFRIFQEALTNVTRHSHATAVEVELRHDADRCNLEIRDNGKGMPRELAANPTSLGLMGMQERALQLGGTTTFIPRPGGGTIVRIEIPQGPHPSALGALQAPGTDQD